MNDFKPYLEVAEETLIRFRTDLRGLAIIRAGLLELASDPRGLDDDETWTDPRDAEEMLLAMPGSTGGRRPAEARLRGNIETRRVEERQHAKEAERMHLIVQRIGQELPDVVAAAKEYVEALMDGTVTDETHEPGSPAPQSAPAPEPTVDA